MPVSTALSPGELLASEIRAHGWSVAEFAERIGVATEEVQEVIDGERRLGPDLSAKIGAEMGSSPALWLKLQDRYLSWRAFLERETAQASA